MNDNLTHFLTALSAYKGENVFNPWRDTSQSSGLPVS